MSDDDEDLDDKTMIMAPGAAQKLATAPKARIKCSNPALLGIGPGAEVLLVDDDVTMGRDSENTVALKADGVSRKHARLFCSNQEWYVEDLGSTNGVRVNGEKVGRSRLKHGDKVEIGSVPYLFSIDSEAASKGDTEPAAFAAKPAAPKPAPASAATPSAAKPTAPKARPAARPAAAGGSNAILWLVVLLGAGALAFAVYSVLA